MNWSVEERRNCRRVVLAVSLLGLAAFGRAARAQDGADEDVGLAVSVGYTGDLRRNTTGGIAVGTAYSDMLDLGATWATNNLFSGTGFTTNLSVMHLGGDDITGEFVGDLHGVNNIEAPDAWHLYEFWSEFNFGGRANTSLRMGLLDLNADFDTPVTSSLFVGSRAWNWHRDQPDRRQWTGHLPRDRPRHPPRRRVQRRL